MSASPPPSSLAGIGFVLLACFCFAWMDALSKILAQSYPVPQIVWVRFLIFAALALAFSGGRGLRAHIRSAHPWLQCARALILVTEIGLIVLALRSLPVADLHAIFAVTPLLVTALSVPVLGETVGARRWAAVALGFVGMLVILRPGLGVMAPGALIVLVASAMFAFYVLLTRLVAATDGPQTSTLYLAVVGALALTLVGPIHWQPMTGGAWLMLLLLGLFSSLGHFLLILALKLAPASVVQPFTYSMILWATLVGHVVFGDFPDGPTLAGAAIIVASGLYAFHRERLQAMAGLPAAEIPAERRD